MQIENLQADTLESFKMKKEQESAPGIVVDESEKLSCLCRGCGAFMCDVRDLRILNESNRVVINKDIYQRMNVESHPKPTSRKNATVDKKVCFVEVAKFIEVLCSSYFLIIVGAWLAGWSVGSVVGPLVCW